MAKISLDDPRFQPLKVEEEDKDKEKKSNQLDVNTSLYTQEDKKPKAEEENEISALTGFTSGVLSGLIKIPEGVASVTAELFDAGGGALFGAPVLDEKSISYAAEVEKFFDTINPFEELAQERATGKISEALTQIAGFGTLGAKATIKGAEKIASKLINAKKSGKLVNPKNKNIKKGLDKADEYNKITGAKRYGIIA